MAGGCIGTALRQAGVAADDVLRRPHQVAYRPRTERLSTRPRLTPLAKRLRRPPEPRPEHRFRPEPAHKGKLQQRRSATGHVLKLVTPQDRIEVKRS